MSFAIVPRDGERAYLYLLQRSLKRREGFWVKSNFEKSVLNCFEIRSFFARYDSNTETKTSSSWGVFVDFRSVWSSLPEAVVVWIFNWRAERMELNSGETFAANVEAIVCVGVFTSCRVWSFRFLSLDSLAYGRLIRTGVIESLFRSVGLSIVSNGNLVEIICGGNFKKYISKETLTHFNLIKT